MKKILVLMLLLAWMLAGCGGDAEPATEADEEAPAETAAEQTDDESTETAAEETPEMNIWTNQVWMIEVGGRQAMIGFNVT